MPDFLTSLSDSEILQKAKLIRDKIGEVSASSALSSAVLDELDSDTDTLAVDLPKHIAAQASARSMRKTKDASVKKTKQTLRSVARKLRAAGSSNAELASLGIHVSAISALPAKATRPFGRVDTSARFQHIIYVVDEAAPDIKRKPRGSIGCEIFVKIGGELPADEKDCTYLTVCAKATYRAEFGGEVVGKQAHYLMRWRMRDGSASAWGETVSATITG
ncbi:hypothetical protein BH10ACI1_BH10ACI1_02310 [soil metagenome]